MLGAVRRPLRARVGAEVALRCRHTRRLNPLSHARLTLSTPCWQHQRQQQGVDGGEPVRLNKRLSELGLCSRRESDVYIQRGLVLVDGAVVDVLGTKVTRQQTVELQETALAQQQAKLTIALHKPRGFISASPSSRRQRAATRLLTPSNHDRQAFCPFGGAPWPPHWRKGLAPAGRLDMDSTGLLILTQDGTVARQLIDGGGRVDKEYHVTVSSLPPPHDGAEPAGRAPGVEDDGREEVVSEGQLTLLRSGLSLDGRRLRPAIIEHIPPPRRRHRRRRRARQHSKLRSSRHNASADEDSGEEMPRAKLRFVLREGRYRQIRRMCEAVGLRVEWLQRVRIGGLGLEGLGSGCWRFLDREDIARLVEPPPPGSFRSD